MFQSKNNSNFKTCKDNSSWRVINPQYFASVPLVAMVQVIIPSSTKDAETHQLMRIRRRIFLQIPSLKVDGRAWIPMFETYISGLGIFMVRFSFVTNSKNEGYMRDTFTKLVVLTGDVYPDVAVSIHLWGETMSLNEFGTISLPVTVTNSRMNHYIFPTVFLMKIFLVRDPDPPLIFHGEEKIPQDSMLCSIPSTNLWSSQPVSRLRLRWQGRRYKQAIRFF